jgi:hypothetical protein
MPDIVNNAAIITEDSALNFAKFFILRFWLASIELVDDG